MPAHFCDCITKHIYFKVFVMFVLSLLITFADDVDILYSKYTFYVFVIVFALLLLTYPNEYGASVLLMLLVILIYNNTLQRKKEGQAPTMRSLAMQKYFSKY